MRSLLAILLIAPFAYAATQDDDPPVAPAPRIKTAPTGKTVATGKAMATAKKKGDGPTTAATKKAEPKTVAKADPPMPTPVPKPVPVPVPTPEPAPKTVVKAEPPMPTPAPKAEEPPAPKVEATPAPKVEVKEATPPALDPEFLEHKAPLYAVYAFGVLAVLVVIRTYLFNKS